MASKSAHPAIIWHDSSYDHRNTEAYDLSLLLREDSYFYVITGLDKTKPLAIGRATGIRMDASSPAESIASFPLPQGLYKRLLIYHYATKFTLAPGVFEDVFRNGVPSHGHEGPWHEEWTRSFQVQGEIVCHFVEPFYTGEVFRSLGSEMHSRHFSACAINLSSRLAREKGAEILLAIYGHTLLTTLVFAHGGLILANISHARTAADAAYYLLDVYRHFAPKHPGLLTLLGGDLRSDQEAGSMVIPYLPRKEDLNWGFHPDLAKALEGEEAAFLGSQCV